MAIIWAFDGSKIATAREVNDMTQTELARRIGAAQHQVAKWESGEVKPGQDNLVAICNVLQCPPRYFFVASDDDNHQKAA